MMFGTDRLWSHVIIYAHDLEVPNWKKHVFMCKVRQWKKLIQLQPGEEFKFSQGQRVESSWQLKIPLRSGHHVEVLFSVLMKVELGS